MTRLERLNALRWAALWHLMASEPGTEARRVRAARQTRLNDAYHAERAVAE